MFGPVIRKYEKEFRTEELENHHVFYDLYIKSDDPQELRNELSEMLADLGYKNLLNELTKFDDSELEETFRGGNVKPIRSFVKSAKDNVKGSKFPTLWKICLILGVILLAVLLASYRDTIYQSVTTVNYAPSGYLLYGTIVLLFLALLFWIVKKVVPLYVWIKIIGVYDPTETAANVRVVMAGDCRFKDKDSYAKLESDLTEMYSELSRKYSNKLNKRAVDEKLSDTLSLRGRPSQNLTQKLKDVEKELSDLERNFVSGKISEAQYKELKERLEMRRAQLETLFDLVA
jgi:hypothetical protein